MRNKSFAALTLTAALVGGCVVVPPPPNRSPTDPSDPSAPAARARRFSPNLIASTHVYLDPNVGKGAQKMGDMGGMQGMGSMDHSKMQGMDQKQQSAGASGGMEGMDHSKMPGMENKNQPAAPLVDKATIAAEMKKTADEMKKASDEMKAKSDAMQKSGGEKAAPSPTASPKQKAAPDAHQEHGH